MVQFDIFSKKIDKRSPSVTYTVHGQTPRYIYKKQKNFEIIFNIRQLNKQYTKYH